MKQISVHEAKAHFSSIVKEVEAGETVIITRHDKPVIELRSIVGRPIPQFGTFAMPGVPHQDVSWTDDELDELFGDKLGPRLPEI
jgi:prevent-host-death family protein